MNTNNIHKIIIKPGKYYFVSRTIDGFEWKFAGSGIGSINSRDSQEFEVCETKDPLDYKIVSDWISKNS
jgi:hypothetical protein